MRFKRHFLLALLFVCFSISVVDAQVTYGASTTRSTENVKTTSHVVRMGETAYSIATAHKTTVEEIYKLNPGSDKGINVGQTLKMPVLVADNTSSLAYTSYEDAQVKHTIGSKETLFSVSQKYNITVAELLKANPGLSESTFSIGREIAIPNFALTTATNRTSTPLLERVEPMRPVKVGHKVEKQETLYSISKKYNCTIQDILTANPMIKEVGLKEGTTIQVPTNDQSIISAYTNESNYDSNYDSYLPEDGVVRVALLLPFIDGSKSKNVPQEKITEYYEGFLLAVQRMKEKGMNAEIFTFDIGNDNDARRLESILGTNELNSLNLIIGGVSDRQVQLISRFSQKTGIKYVVPFSNKNTEVDNNKNIFQVANSHSTLFPKIARGFTTMFRDANIIFLSENGSDKNKMDFVKELQAKLKDSNISFTTAPTTASITNDLNSVIDRSRRNIIVPTSSSEASLKRILEGVDVLAKGRVDVSLFGYPEWQTYINKTKRLHDRNAFIYSMFFLDTNNPDTQLFADRYKRWYNKGLVISYPKFAHMGYDTGIVFLTALQRLGHDFSSRISELNTPTLQSALYFEPASVKGGYINSGVYIVNLKPNGTVDKIEISKQ